MNQSRKLLLKQIDASESTLKSLRFQKEQHRLYFLCLQREHPSLALFILLPAFWIGWQSAKSQKSRSLFRKAIHIGLLSGVKAVKNQAFNII